MSYPDELPFPEELKGILSICNDCARGLDCETHRFKGFAPLEEASDESSNPSA